MAKRVRMDSSSLLKTLQTQSLLNTPEAEKIRMLDDEMAKIAGNKTLKTHEKVQKFEETLAQFKNIQNKIIKQGGVSLVEDQSSEKEFIDALKSALAQVMVHPSPTGNDQMETDSGIARQPHDDNDDQLDESDIPGTPQRNTSAEQPKTPVQEIEVAYSTPAAKTPRAQAIAAKTSLEHFLQAEGLALNKDGKIDVGKLNGDNKKNTVFATSTYQKVLSFLASPNVKKSKPYRANNLIKIIHKTVKEKNPREFKKMLKKMPNLKSVDEEYSRSEPLIVPNWESM